jgi:hypothetical protein
MALFVVRPCLAEIFTVHPDGTGGYPTIQAAIEASEHGDVIELTNGTYRGEGNRDVSYLGKGITVRSQSGDPTVCVIDCEGSAEDPHRAFLFQNYEPSGAILEGLTIMNGVATEGGAIITFSAAPIIRGCVFIANTAEQDGGAILISWDTETFKSTVLKSCVIARNQADRGGGVAGYRAVSEFESCVIVENRARVGGGCFLEQSPTHIHACTVAGNRAEEEGGGIWGSNVVDVWRSVLWGNCALVGAGEGYFVPDLPACPTIECSVVDSSGLVADTATFEQTTFLDPLFCDPVDPCSATGDPPGDYAVSSSSPCLPQSNPCLVLIGALGEGCAVNPTLAVSWGKVKALFRPR